MNNNKILYSVLIYVNQSLLFYYRGVKNQEPLKVGAKQTSLYTWQDPNQKRELLWSCGEKKNEKNELLKVGIQALQYVLRSFNPQVTFTI